MKIIFVLLVVSVQCLQWTPCDPVSQSIIQSVQGEPDHPNRGQDQRVVLSGILPRSRVIRGGRVNIEVRLGAFPVFFRSYNLCDVSTCPLQSQFVITTSMAGSDTLFAPAGAYVATSRLMDEFGDPVICLQNFFSLY